MSIAQYVRPLAICLFSRADRILVAEYYDPGKEEKFLRPVGGGIEFGEYAADAIAREVREELGAAVCGVRYLFTLENLFVYNGEHGHEIVLVHDGVFVDETLYERHVLYGTDSCEGFEAFWKSRRELQADMRPVYPSGLLERLGET